jgi:hypothetical protein
MHDRVFELLGSKGISIVILFGYWILLLIAAICFAFYRFDVSPDSRSKNFKRKYFHALAVMMFAPAYRFMVSQVFMLRLKYASTKRI